MVMMKNQDRPPQRAVTAKTTAPKIEAAEVTLDGMLSGTFIVPIPPILSAWGGFLPCYGIDLLYHRAVYFYTPWPIRHPLRYLHAFLVIGIIVTP